ncbi:MAG: DNA-binding domain-containing protein [Pseudomonadota bacterium]
MSSYQAALIDVIFSTEKAQSNALKVYQNNYLENALNALSIEFPTVKHLLGEDNFRGMMSQYINTHPKSDFNWSYFGQHMNDFLLSDALSDSGVLEEMPFLVEVASIDWQFRMIEKMDDVPFQPSSFALMQSHPPENLSFEVATGFGLIEAYFPVDLFIDLPTVSGTDQYPPYLEKVKKAIESAIKLSQPRSFVVWRREYQPCIQALDERQRQTYERLAENASVQEVLESVGSDAEAISAWLQNAIQAQQICAVVNE